MASLKVLLEENTTKGGRIFDLSIQFLIVLSVLTFSVDTLPDNSAALTKWLDLIEMICVIIFSIEYILRLIVADKKVKFIFSFYAIIDLMAVLPFYLALGVDLRSIRALRLLKLFRLFKLVRYSKASDRFRKAMHIAKEEIILFLSMMGILTFFASAGIYYFENAAQPEKYSSIFESMWWAICTLTTVGYGDVYPITNGGRIFTFVVLIIGLGLISVPAGLVASAFNKVRREE
ncbi:MAG: ion transporter [Flavobacteriales bacterium]|nr:ion transporter [Flavobacteriales bacterium]